MRQPTKRTRTNIGRALILLRQRHDFTQEELAASSGLPINMIRKLEDGGGLQVNGLLLLIRWLFLKEGEPVQPELPGATTDPDDDPPAE